MHIIAFSCILLYRNKNNLIARGGHSISGSWFHDRSKMRGKGVSIFGIEIHSSPRLGFVLPCNPHGRGLYWPWPTQFETSGIVQQTSNATAVQAITLLCLTPSLGSGVSLRVLVMSDKNQKAKVFWIEMITGVVGFTVFDGHCEVTEARPKRGAFILQRWTFISSNTDVRCE